MKQLSTEWGKRVRAGLVLGETSVADLAARLGLSEKSLLRTIRGERTPRPHESAAIAKALELPEAFLDPRLSPASVLLASECLISIETFRRALDEEEARLRDLLSGRPNGETT